MHRFLVRTIALVAAMTLVATACDDEESGLTKEDWIKAAAAICADASADFQALFDTGFPTSPDGIQDFVTKVVPIVEGEVTELRGLDTPEEDADKIEAALDKGEQAVDDLREASETPEAAGALFSAEGGENLNAFETEMTDLGVPECDPDDEGEEGPQRLDPSTFSPEKAAFVAAGDAICTDLDAAVGPAEDQYLDPFPPPLENWSSFLGVLIPAVEEALGALEALEPPAADAGQIEDILSRLRGQAEDLNEMKAAADAGDQEAFDEVSQPVFDTFDEIDGLFVEYGFQVCGPSDEDEDAPEAGGEGDGGADEGEE